MFKYLQIFVFCIFIASCNTKIEFSQYKSIENFQWKSEGKVEFIVDNLDTISRKNVFINIRNNKEYPFSSIFLIGEIEFPKGLKIIDTLEYEMTDAQGHWLGTGFDIKDNKFFYKENVVFNEKGDFKFTVKQATRGIKDIEGEEPLKGIIDVGLSIEKVEND